MLPPLVFAFNFANPALLGGLVAASVPIIIHLLNRRKFREIRWAAMRFLLAAIRKNSRRIRIEQWILLAVRTLLILMVVLAMAKPYLESLGALPVIAGRRTHRVLVLDGSLSMAYTVADVTRFEQAKTLAVQLVRDARRGDAISVVLMADPPRVVIGDPSPNHAEVQKEIEEITLPHGGTDLEATFRAIDRVLEASTISQKEVVFLTDLQAASWRRGSDDDGLKRVLAKLDAYKPRSVVIDLGKSGGENRAVTELRLRDPIITVDHSTIIRALVHNYGPNRVEGLRVRLMIDGRLGPEHQPINLEVGEDQPAVFNYTFTAPGDHLLEVQIDDDPLKLDNRRWLAVPVREHLNILLVDGHFKPEPFQAETDYLAQALSPAATSQGSPSVIHTEVVAESQLSRRDLSPYDAVVLCNIGQFTEPEVTALDDYLKQGGGVVVFGGDQVVADNYNRLLYDDGKGILPAAVGPTVGDAGKKASFSFNPLDFRHPIIDEFDGTSDEVKASLTGTRTWQFHKLKLPPGSPAQVALAFDNGDPAVIEARRHRGTVIQVATSADDGWNTWPLHPSYPPVMEKMMFEAASGRLAERNVRVGQPLDQALPPAGTAAAVAVVLPDGQTVPTKLQAAGGVSQLHFEKTELSGAYQVRVGPPLVLESSFTANTNPAESDPAKLDRAGLADAMPGWSFAYLTNWKELTRSASSVSRHGELHRFLLYGVLMLLIVESILAWIYGHHAPRT